MYEENKEHPQSIDVGAGHGFMTWKTLLAGRKCDAVEQQEPTYQVLMQNVGKVENFLSEGETVKSLCKVIPVDFFKFKDKEDCKSKYDFCWAGNIIHLLTPSQVNDFTSILFDITKPGGVVYATVHTVSAIPSAIELFYKNKDAGIPNPGYMFLNRTIYGEYNLSTKEAVNSEVKMGDAFPISDGEEISPTIIKDGFYEHEATKVKWSEVGRTKSVVFYKVERHSAMHFFDPHSLKRIFEQGKFLVEEAYYITSDGQKVTDELQQEDLKHHKYAVAVKARKPLNN